MVAISLYRGNLHRAPDVPRRWLMPTHKISLKDFRTLLHRRERARSRLRSASSSNPNPDSNQNVESHKPDVPLIEPKVEPDLPEASNAGVPALAKDEGGGSSGGDCSVKPVDEPDSKPANGGGTVHGDGDGNLQVVEKPAEETKANGEKSDKFNELNEKEKRKRDVEEKLQVLNAKKHNLVQVLKQILNAEEELKRRNSMQGMAIRATVTLQVEATNDSGSVTRHPTPRMGSEANVAGDNEGGEADDVSNHNTHSRHVLRMSSTSPSSESPLRRASFIQHNVVPHPSRASMGVSGSPSRFAPAGIQGHPGNLPTVSVSGTNYVASSPSPAASGGTSVFRDARQPSPWN